MTFYLIPLIYQNNINWNKYIGCSFIILSTRQRKIIILDANSKSCKEIKGISPIVDFYLNVVEQLMDAPYKSLDHVIMVTQRSIHEFPDTEFSTD